MAKIKLTREERLAQALRDNLRKRKAPRADCALGDEVETSPMSDKSGAEPSATAA